jgi:hypothetical protein
MASIGGRWHPREQSARACIHFPQFSGRNCKWASNERHGNGEFLVIGLAWMVIWRPVASLDTSAGHGRPEIGRAVSAVFYL